MNAVKEWLNGNRGFDTGVKLFVQNGGSKFYQRMFANAGPTDFNKKKLAAELEKLAATSAPVSMVEFAPPAQKAPSLHPPPDKAADNRKYLDLLKKKDTLYTTLNMLIIEKRHLPNGEKLRVCAFSIIKTHQQLTECWALIDYYQEHQSFPASPEVVQRDDKTAIQYLRQSISRARSRLKNPKCRDRAATELLIKEKEAELAKLTYKPQPK